VIRLAGIVATIGIADSLNPTTIAPALYLASHHAPRREIARFTLGVFLVYLLGGAVIALGPGQLALSLLPHPSHRVQHTVEVVVGLGMVFGSVLLWRGRSRLSGWNLPAPRGGGHSSTVLGATIMAFELPTAFPYFGAIAAIVSSGAGVARQLALLVLFNVCFVLPLLVIVATLWLAGDGAAEILERWRGFLQRHWPSVLSALAMAAGVFVVFLGVTGFLLHGRGDLNHFARSLRHLLHLSTKS
jgi:cytochrome c biogenesis protein CcdA